MKIASWNVNSLRVRLPQVLDYLDAERPDILALQETKLPDEAFPSVDLEAAGYHSLYSGQKTYNGVAILSREPASEELRGLPGLEDPQRRVLGATIGGIRVLDLYVPNGQSVDSDKYVYKLDWLEKLHQHLATELARYEDVVVLGDFNIAPEDRDVHDPEAWAGQVLCSEPEREALRRIQALGLEDSFRLHHDEDGRYSWWDYRAAAFRRDRGLRIDLVLASRSLAAKCRAADIDREPRAWERPSDHTPVWAEFDL